MKFLKYSTTFILIVSLMAPGHATFAADGSNTTLDQGKADAIAKSAGFETAKAVIMTVGAVACAALAAVNWFFGLSEAACPAISIGVGVAGLGLDLAGAKDAQDRVSKATSALPGLLTSLATMTATNAAKSAAQEAAKKAGEQAGEKAAEQTTEKTASNSAEKIGCYIGAITLGAQAAMAYAAAAGDRKAHAELVDTANHQRALGNTRLENGLDPTGTPFPDYHFRNGGGPNGGNNNRDVNTAQGPGANSKPCSNDSGDAYLKCLGNAMPEVAALTSNPAFRGAVDKLLGGKNLGDFVKGYDGDSPQDLAKYIGANSPVPGMADFAMGAVASIDKVLKDNDLKGKETDTMVATNYKSGGDRAPATPEGGDDFSKMMADMMKKLNPDGDPKKPGEDPSELVFRQLDILPAEKILQNKDISLFARIGFRYRKKADDVDHLNWASEKNQATSK